MSITEEGEQHDVLAGLALVRQGLDLLLEGDGRAWSLTDGQVHDAIVEVTAQANRLEAARLSLVRAAVSREDDPAAPRATVQLLKRRCRATGGRARADIENAALTCPASGTLRSLGAALAEGAVTGAHVDVARRCLTRIPSRLVRAQREVVDAELTRRARDWDTGTTEHLAAHLLSRLAPHTGDRYDPESLHRRQLATATDSTGMLLIRGQLDPAGGAKVRSVLDHLSNLNRHLPTRDLGAPKQTGQTEQSEQTELAVPDLRTLGQRRADALVTMAGLAAEQLNLTTDPQTGHPTQGLRPARTVPRIVVLTTPDQLADHTAGNMAGHMAGDVAGAEAAAARGCTYRDGGLLDPGTLQRLACDAVIDRVILSPTGRVLRMDTLGRLATEAQLTALTARDGGCVWPGCTAPPSICEAHHVIWWSRGGKTVIDNLALLCPVHHTRIHAEPDDPTGWQLTIRDGIPWFTPPEHADPDRTPVRNTLRDAVHHTRRVGDQLRLTLDSTRGWAAVDPPQPPS